VKKSEFYDVWRRNVPDLNTLSCTDVALHARRRKALALAFTDQSVKATIPFVERHVDRWNQLLPSEKLDEEGWSTGQNLSEWTDYLMFDLFGDICFGKKNDTKEPGENVLKHIPHDIAKYLKLYNPVSPLLRTVTVCIRSANRRSLPNLQCEVFYFGSSLAVWMH
jgi:hypothetical protein